MSAILKFDFQKREQLRFFWSKLSKQHKKDPILHVATTFFLKQEETRTSDGPIPHPLSKWIACTPTFASHDLSREQITFLDLEIFKGPKFRATGKLDNRVHTKKVDTFQYLEASSSHAPSVFKGLIIDECQQYCRLSTSETDFIAKTEFFKQKLLLRGYNETMVETQMNKVQYKNRS